MGKRAVLRARTLYNTCMRLWVLPLLIAVIMIASPSTAFAAKATFFGPIIPPECNCESVGSTVASAADWGCVMQTAQNGINFALSFSLIIAVLVIAYVGATFVISPANPGTREQGRTMITNVVLGAIVMASAWLLVDFVMKIVYSPSTEIDGKEFGPWNEILKGTQDNICVKVAKNPPPLPGVIGGEADGVPTAGPGSIGGSCSVPTSGNCAPAALSAFGSAASEAAQICNAESQGIIKNVSTSDVMRNDPRHRAFSFGLFQINLTYHNVGGNKCPDAFNGHNYDATVKNEALYARCVAAAQTAAANIAEAVATHSRTGWTEWSTASKCGLALLDIPVLALSGKPLVDSSCRLSDVSFTL